MKLTKILLLFFILSFLVSCVANNHMNTITEQNKLFIQRGSATITIIFAKPKSNNFSIKVVPTETDKIEIDIKDENGNFVKDSSNKDIKVLPILIQGLYYGNVGDFKLIKDGINIKISDLPVGQKIKISVKAYKNDKLLASNEKIIAIQSKELTGNQGQNEHLTLKTPEPEVVSPCNGCSNSGSGSGGGGSVIPTATLNITSITPNTGFNDANTQITIAGTGFQNGSTVKVGETNVFGVTMVSSSQIKAKVPLGMAVGTYNLTLTNPDGSSKTLPNIFTLQVRPPISWTQAPGPVGGSITNIIIDPTNSSKVYSTSNGIVYKSNDSGATWSNISAITAGFLKFEANTIKIDPSNPSIMYAGTRSNFNCSCGGIFKSTDGGITWSNVISGGINVSNIAIDPITPTIVYVTGSNWTTINSSIIANTFSIHPNNSSIIYIGAGQGVFKSIDSGVTWSASNSGLTTLSVNSIVIDPTNPTTLYAATSNGIFKSANSGENWENISTGLANLNIFKIAIDPITSKNLYVVTNGGVFKSINSGNTWSVMTIDTQTPSFSSFVPIIIDPTNPAVIYLGTNLKGIYKSVDSGSTWNPSNTGITSLGISKLVVDPIANTNLYAGVPGLGIFKSTDSGNTWILGNNGLTDLDIRELVVNPVNSTTLFVGTVSGIFKSVNSGGLWSSSNNGLTNLVINSIIINPLNPSILYASTDGGLFKSTNTGDTWTAFSQTNLEIRNLVISSVNPSILYGISTKGVVVKSTDSGVTWLLTSLINLSGNLALAIDPVNPSNIYAESGTVVYRSTDGGDSWSSSALGSCCFGDFNQINILSLAVDPITPSIVYAGTNGGLANGSVFRSTDSGFTWNRINDGLPSYEFYNTLAIDPINPSKVYVGTFGKGIFKIN